MIGNAIQPELEQIIEGRDWPTLRQILAGLDVSDIAELLIDLPFADEGIIFRMLPRNRAADVFSHLPADHQEELIGSLSSEQMQSIVDGMSPDDRTRLFEEMPAAVTKRLLDSLSAEKLAAARKLLGYPAETAGRYMTPAYVALTPAMTVAQALDHIRRSPRATETLNVVYVIDSEGRLVKDLRLATLVRAEPTTIVGEIDDRSPVSVLAHDDRESVLKLIEKYDRVALPVTDDAGHMLGIITVDDMLDVAELEATEDMHKLGGLEALDEPYHTTNLWSMLKKRGGWLSVLFMGEMLTASAMGHFEMEIQQAVVLALFVPLIISSGGNSGSQAATLIIRALALRELRLSDFGRVALRELGAGVVLGAWLGMLGFIRIVIWQRMGWVDYSEHYLLVAMTVLISLVGVVTFGTLTGSMLPFLLRAVGFDPATSSAPFVATLVDVTGLVIYFTIALYVLQGTLL